MTIWILALILFGILGSLGRQVGAIRMGISLIGVTVGVFAAGPLAPFFRTLLELATVKDQITLLALGAPVAFLTVLVIFNSIAAAVYQQVSRYYKYRVDDDIRLQWERMDGQLGLCVGLVAAVGYLVAASAYVYHVGNITKQFESPGENPFSLKLVNKMRDDLSSTKFDRVAAGIGKVSPELTQTADLLGLLYNNNELQTRLPDYPLFTSLTENSELRNLFTGQPFAAMLPAKTNVSLILNDPTTEQVMNHAEIKRVLKELDKPDLVKFLKTGRSEIFSKEPLLGKWQLDIASTVKHFARANPKATVVDHNRLRGILRYRMADYLLVATPDSKVFVKGTQKPLPAFPVLLTQRFAFTGQPPAMPTNQPPTILSGTWKKAADKYQVVVRVDKTDLPPADAGFVENGKLAAGIGGNVLVFDRIE